MSGLVEVQAKLETRAAEADAMIAALRRHIAEVRKATLARVEQVLIAENANLAAEIETLKSQLIQVEIGNGIKQVNVPVKEQKTLAREITKKDDVIQQGHVVQPSDGGHPPESQPTTVDSSHKKSPTKKLDIVGKLAKGQEEPEVVDVGRLDLRVGLIVSAKKHPDADTLYVEEVDVGEEKLRTVVSGLVRFISLADMQNRPAVLLCNLKPAKMRGVVSEAMVMCASTPDMVEVLRPPHGCRPGQRVLCEGFTATQPDRELNPKKKVFERIAPDLKTDDDRVATYKGVRWTVDGVTGHVVADTLANVNIK